MTFVVGGEDFELQKPFVALHSPNWKRRLDAEPQLERVELEGDADSFGAFVAFLKGGEVTADNVVHLLSWAKEFDVGYVPARCEEFLLLRPPEKFRPAQLLELAARYDMPLLYTRATEALAHGMIEVDVPEAETHELAALAPAFATKAIREDVLRAHVSVGLLRGDTEARRRQRFADYAALAEPHGRARLLWKSRQRFVPPPPEQPPHDWRSLQTVWPHHSLRGADWTVVPTETQPTIPLRDRGIASRSGAGVSGAGRF